MAKKRDDTSDMPIPSIPAGVKIPFGAQTAVKFAKTTVGATIISAVSPMTGTPVSPGQVKAAATVADAAISAHKGSKKGNTDVENNATLVGPSPFNKKPKF